MDDKENAMPSTQDSSIEKDIEKGKKRAAN
jgi:hypothetical protein